MIRLLRKLVKVKLKNKIYDSNAYRLLRMNSDILFQKPVNK